MITGFDRILIEVPDLDAAVEEYSTFLGSFQRVDARVARLPLSNLSIELCASANFDEVRIAGLVMVDGALPDEASGAHQAQPVPPPNRGLRLERVGETNDTAETTTTSHGISAVDHLVLQTNDAEDCIRIFGEEGLGIRLALDQLVPEWGGRMLFFRAGKMTLEVIHNQKQPLEQDFFWGITYLCQDLDTTIDALDAAGVSHSEIREGRKPGTRVASVKSHTLGLPTLLIEPASPA